MSKGVKSNVVRTDFQQMSTDAENGGVDGGVDGSTPNDELEHIAL
jgi:hypothetical protein